MKIGIACGESAVLANANSDRDLVPGRSSQTEPSRSRFEVQMNLFREAITLPQMNFSSHFR